VRSASSCPGLRGDAAVDRGAAHHARPHSCPFLRHRRFGGAGDRYRSWGLTMDAITQVLNSIEQGDPHAAEQLLPLVYDELRKLAGQKLAREKPGHTLQATALVHEAYLRLVASDKREKTDAREGQWDNRGHFFAAAAEAMRRILVDEARRRQAAKRGGLQNRVEMPESRLSAPMPDEELLALHEALEELAKVDSTAAALVRLRFFTGLKTTEAAEVLGMSVRSAHDLWAYARSWLRRKTKDH
jgi:RNA polymerase sigma factor (TIGR02999 family)